MDAYVITLRGHEYSERVAARCIQTAKDIGGIDVRRFDAVSENDAIPAMQSRGLQWTWGNGGAGLDHHSYGGRLAPRIGCAMSHFMLWERCVLDDTPLLILEHDAVFIRPFVPFEFEAVCQINDPEGATARGEWWHDQMVKRGDGVWPKTRVFNSDRPDGLAGNSAYVTKPAAAFWLTELVHDIGVWPNDAIMCVQLIQGLQEHYPFITKVEPERSTINV